MRFMVVTPWEEKIVESMESMMLLDPNRAMMVLIFLWDMCDPGSADLHPDKAFEE
jgi:hypothetical protein